MYTHLILTQVRDLVPESQAYMDLLAFERKLDATIARKRLEIQEMLRRPLKEKRKLRVFIAHHFFTAELESGVSDCVCILASVVRYSVLYLSGGTRYSSMGTED